MTGLITMSICASLSYFHKVKITQRRNRFADRDMLMRYFGGGIGHLSIEVASANNHSEGEEEEEEEYDENPEPDSGTDEDEDEDEDSEDDEEEVEDWNDEEDFPDQGQVDIGF